MGKLEPIKFDTYQPLRELVCETLRDAIRRGILEPGDPRFREKYQDLSAAGAMFRVNHRSWWKEELPSAEEYAAARENLARHNMEVDYIITHCQYDNTLSKHSAYDCLVLGSAVCEVAAEMGRGKVKRVGIQDQFGESAPYERLLAKNGVTVENIVAIAESL